MVVHVVLHGLGVQVRLLVHQGPIQVQRQVGAVVGHGVVVPEVERYQGGQIRGDVAGLAEPHIQRGRQLEPGRDLDLVALCLHARTRLVGGALEDEVSVLVEGGEPGPPLERHPIGGHVHVEVTHAGEVLLHHHGRGRGDACGIASGDVQTEGAVRNYAALEGDVHAVLSEGVEEPRRHEHPVAHWGHGDVHLVGPGDAHHELLDVARVVRLAEVLVRSLDHHALRGAEGGCVQHAAHHVCALVARCRRAHGGVKGCHQLAAKQEIGGVHATLCHGLVVEVVVAVVGVRHDRDQHCGLVNADHCYLPGVAADKHLAAAGGARSEREEPNIAHHHPEVPAAVHSAHLREGLVVVGVVDHHSGEAGHDGLDTGAGGQSHITSALVEPEVELVLTELACLCALRVVLHHIALYGPAHLEVVEHAVKVGEQEQRRSPRRDEFRRALQALHVVQDPIDVQVQRRGPRANFLRKGERHVRPRLRWDPRPPAGELLVGGVLRLIGSTRARIRAHAVGVLPKADGYAGLVQ
mmetsp:Transcript_12301/g.20810  ORF Transcript_12301/g.20810 Transcript_12301/m.20810 type:complete len:523 (-) Transcript_12301:393-1961(-)